MNKHCQIKIWFTINNQNIHATEEPTTSEMGKVYSLKPNSG